MNPPDSVVMFSLPLNEEEKPARRNIHASGEKSRAISFSFLVMALETPSLAANRENRAYPHSGYCKLERLLR